MRLSLPSPFPMLCQRRHVGGRRLEPDGARAGRCCSSVRRALRAAPARGEQRAPARRAARPRLRARGLVAASLLHGSSSDGSCGLISYAWSGRHATRTRRAARARARRPRRSRGSGARRRACRRHRARRRSGSARRGTMTSVISPDSTCAPGGAGSSAVEQLHLLGPHGEPAAVAVDAGSTRR